MINRHSSDRQPRGKMQFPVKSVSIAVAAVIFLAVVILFFNPRLVTSLVLQVSRVKNAFSHYVLKERPHFYYLEMEKNGKDIRVSRNEALEITYRDEFVVKSVVSDDLSGKYTTVKFEGFSAKDNDFRVLLKGIDFVNKIIKTSAEIDKSGVVSDYEISVYYKNEKIDRVPLKIVITPQDWFRFAKDASNVNEQIEYLKKAIALNQNDISVRKILAEIGPTNAGRRGRVMAVNYYRKAFYAQITPVTGWQIAHRIIGC